MCLNYQDEEALFLYRTNSETSYKRARLQQRIYSKFLLCHFLCPKHVSCSARPCCDWEERLFYVFFLLYSSISLFQTLPLHTHTHTPLMAYIGRRRCRMAMCKCFKRFSRTELERGIPGNAGAVGSVSLRFVFSSYLSLPLLSHSLFALPNFLSLSRRCTPLPFGPCLSRGFLSGVDKLSDLPQHGSKSPTTHVSTPSPGPTSRFSCVSCIYHPTLGSTPSPLFSNVEIKR